jgi:hypothetical protein
MAFAVPTQQQAIQQQAGAATLDPNQLAQVSPTTTSEQLAGILNKGGALMQQAATTGNQQAAGRGLLNSSMGIQAAQNAVLSAATPIANADANAINSAGQFNAQATNQTLTQNTQNQQATNQFNAQQGNAMNTWNAGQQNEAALKTMDVNSREQLMNIEATYKSLMQNSSSASGMYEQMLKNLADIQGNKDMDAASKQSAIQNQLTYLRSGMTMIQNLGGLSGLVTF